MRDFPENGIRFLAISLITASHKVGEAVTLVPPPLSVYNSELAA